MFKTNWSLKVHVTKREEQLCSKCGKVLCNKNDLKIHDSRSQNLKHCKVYSKKFFSKYFKHHMYAEHQQLIEESE